MRQRGTVAKDQIQNPKAHRNEYEQAARWAEQDPGNSFQHMPTFQDFPLIVLRKRLSIDLQGKTNEACQPKQACEDPWNHQTLSIPCQINTYGHGRYRTCG